MATILTIAFAFGSAVYAFDNKYLLIAAVILFYVIIQRLINRRRKQKYLTASTIYYAGEIFKLKSFMDSGNSLTDPTTKLPVCIISLPVFLKMFPNISADKILLHQLDDVVKNGYYIDYNTINGNGKIFVFKPDKMKINGTDTRNVLLGVSAKDFGNSKYDALLNINLGGVL